MPLMNLAVVPLSTARRERKGCKPKQSSSMFYCTPAVNGVKLKRGPSFTLFARDEHPGRILVYRTST